MRDRNAKGRANVAKGPQKKSTKLSVQKVIAIRKALGDGVGWKALAKKYGVTTSAIQKVRDRTSWAWVDAAMGVDLAHMEEVK